MSKIKIGGYLQKTSNSWLVSAVLFLILWLLFSNLPLLNRYIPSPLKVFNAFWLNKTVLSSQFYSTFINALLGFLLGLFFATITTLIIISKKETRPFFSLFAVVIYSVPLIAAAPLASLLFSANRAGIVLGCIGSYLPIFLTGLRYGDRISNNLHNMIFGFGATDKTEIKFLRFPLIVRGWVIGCQSGWMWAVLGALLGDFAGNNWGLGTFLIGSISQGDPIKVWAIALLCLLMSVIGLLIIQGIGRIMKLHGTYDPLDISVANVPTYFKLKHAYKNILWFVIFLLIWQIASWVLKIGGGIFAGPIDIASYVSKIANNKTNISIEVLLLSLKSTWLLSIFGVLLSISLAFLFACNR